MSMELQLHQIRRVTAMHFQRKAQHDSEPRGWVSIEITLGNYGKEEVTFELTLFTGENVAFGQALADGINGAAALAAPHPIPTLEPADVNEG